MDLQYYGGNCITLTLKGVRVVIDDTLANLGLKPITKAGDLALFTGSHEAPAAETKLTIDHPGEYEVADISITGIPARAHLDEAGQKSTTMFKISANDLEILVTGHIYPDLSDSQLEAIGLVDLMVVPVGGNGYTLDPVGALQIIKKVEPKLVVPTHYADSKLKYEVPQQDLEQVLKNMAMEPKETTAKLRVKPADLTDTTQLIVVERS